MKKTRMLKKNYEFSNIFSKGKYYSGESIEAFILGNGKKINYLGLAVSVKCGHAYQRNRVKRLLRESYRQFENDIREGNSIIFLWKKKKDINEANSSQIKKDMKEILEKSKLIVKSDLK